MNWQRFCRDYAKGYIAGALLASSLSVATYAVVYLPKPRPERPAAVIEPLDAPDEPQDTPEPEPPAVEPPAVEAAAVPTAQAPQQQYYPQYRRRWFRRGY